MDIHRLGGLAHFKVGDVVKRNSEAHDKGYGLSPPTIKDFANRKRYFDERGEITEVEMKYGSICAVRVKWERGAFFRYDKPQKVLVLVNLKNWLEDELFEI